MPSQKPVEHAHDSYLNLSDSKTFQWFYERNHLAIFRFIYGLRGRSIEDVEDLTTTVFLQAWKSRRRFRGNQDAALGWLLKIARNLVIDRYRRNKRNGIMLDIEKQIIPSRDRLPEDQVSINERIKILEGLLVKLPQQHKEMIVLRYILGWRVKDVAAQLEMSENHVSVTIRRILKRMHDGWPEI